jgi:hypothetical protein
MGDKIEREELMMKKAIIWGVVALTLLAVAGCNTDDDPYKAPDPVLKLTITNIPEDLTPSIKMAYLLGDSPSLGVVTIPTTPLASAMNLGGTFSFRTPILGNAFGTLGDYFIVLTDTTNALALAGGKKYTYAEIKKIGGLISISSSKPIKYTFATVDGNTVNWDEFIDLALKDEE